MLIQTLSAQLCLPPVHILQLATQYTHLQGKMKAYSLFICINLCYISRYISIKIKPELKKNILKFGYGINYKHEGMLAYSSDIFNVVTKFILLFIKDLKFSKLNYDSTCAYLQEENGCPAETKKCILALLVYCRKIKPYVDYYKQQIKIKIYPCGLTSSRTKLVITSAKA